MRAVGETAYSLHLLAADLLAQAKSNLSSNGVVVPVFHTFNVLLEADVFEGLEEDPCGLDRWAFRLVGYTSS